MTSVEKTHSSGEGNRDSSSIQAFNDEAPRPFWIFFGHSHVGLLRAGESQPWVHHCLCPVMWVRFRLWIFAGSVAFWDRRGSLGWRGAAPLAAGSNMTEP